MSQITFPAPSAQFGTITHVAIYGPTNHPWWAFWRRKYFVRVFEI